MGLLLAFLPFLLFVIIDKFAGTLPGLAAATLVSAALLVRTLISRGQKVKILELGTTLLFGGLAIFSILMKDSWSIVEVRLRVDTGLLLIVLISMIIHQPFTLQYAREQTSKDVWDTPRFLHVNYVITAVWAVAFTLMVAADLILVYARHLPPTVGIVITLGALFMAARFTTWYSSKQ